TTYAVLFAVIGETYGNGNGTTTFNVPDLRGLVPAGLDNMGGSSANRITDAQADVLGGEVGAEDHVLTVAELAAHNHSVGRFTGSGNNIPQAASTSSQLNVGTSSTGSGDPHANVQPTLFLNYIIKT